MKVTNEMVDRFLSWPLPRTFSPDAGISFAKTYNGYKDGIFTKDIPRSPEGQAGFWPVGTNLFTADEARAMLEHALADAPASPLAPERTVAEHTHPVLDTDDGNCEACQQENTDKYEWYCPAHGELRCRKCGWPNVEIYAPERTAAGLTRTIDMQERVVDGERRMVNVAASPLLPGLERAIHVVELTAWEHDVPPFDQHLIVDAIHAEISRLKGEGSES